MRASKFNELSSASPHPLPNREGSLHEADVYGCTPAKLYFFATFHFTYSPAPGLLYNPPVFDNANVAELVDALVLGASGVTRESSSLSVRTTAVIA